MRHVLSVDQNCNTTINGTLEAQRLCITNSTARPIEINNMMHNGPYLAAISQNHSNNDLLFALRCLPLNKLWCLGAATSNQYIISHENSTKFSIQPIGNTTISGNLDVAGRIDGSHLYVQPKSSTNSATMVFDQSMSSEFGSDSHDINVYGRQGGNSHLKSYNGKSGSVCNVLTYGNLDVGTAQAVTSIKAYVNHAGHQGNVQIEARWKSQGCYSF